ncbi:MAG: hypothetical protein AAF985_17155 [Bacteroidota bacterium]
MFRFYTPILLLQLFCLYHAYSRQEEQRWFWIILFFPFFGSLFYLYHSFYSRRNMEHLAEGMKSTLINNYKTTKLEKALNFSDTFTNKMRLADEYYQNGSYAQAKQLYESCLSGLYKDDTRLLMKLINVNDQLSEYEEVIRYGEQIIDEKAFNQSNEKIILARAYQKKGRIEKAEQMFKQTDIRFSNYEQRIAYAQFLEQAGKVDLAKKKLEALLAEIDSMDTYERRQKRQTARRIKNYYTEWSNP